MKIYPFNKNTLCQITVVCFMFLYLNGCMNEIQVEPATLDFGETEDYLSFSVEIGPLSYSSWYIAEDVPWVTDVYPEDDSSSADVEVSIDRGGLDPGEYSGVLIIMWSSSDSVAATVSVKMTVPGDDDYTTTTTELPTTTTTIPVSTSTTTEPVTTSSTTTSLFIGDPPEILSISFPDEIIADGKGNSGTVSFTDPDGDIVRAYFKLVSGYGFSSSNFDPMESLQEGDATNGTFGFNIWCTGATRYMELEITLKDQAGNMSNAETFGFTCMEE